ATVSGPMFAIEVVPGERMSPFVASLGARPMRIAVHRELHSMAGPDPSTASTRHVEFELPEGVIYRAGDHLGVIPHNSDSLVRRVAARFGFEKDAFIRLHALAARMQSHERVRFGFEKDAFIRLHARSERRTFLPIGERISVHSLLADYVELQDIASRAHIRALANYTECPFTKTALEGLPAENGGTYRDEVLLMRKSVVDLMEQFPACKLPLEIYLEMLPPLAPRYYSISSS